MQMSGSVSAAMNTRAQLCSDQVLWGMGEDPKNSYHWSIYQKVSPTAQGMQESKETKAMMGASFQRCLHLLWKKPFTTQLEILNQQHCTHKHTPSATSRTPSKTPVVAYSSSGQAHTKTEWDGTGHPSLSSNPGAQASRQDFDHVFSQICSKFIPEPTRQIRRGSA